MWWNNLSHDADRAIDCQAIGPGQARRQHRQVDAGEGAQTAGSVDELKDLPRPDWLAYGLIGANALINCTWTVPAWVMVFPMRS